MTAVIVAGFGTLDASAYLSGIAPVFARVREALDGIAVLQAFTSQRVCTALAGVAPDALTVGGALSRAQALGVTDVAVLPLFFTRGSEFQKLWECLGAYGHRFKSVRVAPCALDAGMAEKTAGAVQSVLAPGTQYVLAGHGVADGTLNAVYAGFELVLHGRGATNAHVLTLHGIPTVDERVGQLRGTLGGGSLTVQPLMLVAGSHAKKEMFGRGDTLESRLCAGGFSVRCVTKGLGEYDAIQRLYADCAVQLAFEEP